MVLAVAIFVATLVLVIWQPRGLGIGWSALGGAAVALVAGVVHLSDIPVVWDIVWNATLTFRRGHHHLLDPGRGRLLRVVRPPRGALGAG